MMSSSQQRRLGKQPGIKSVAAKPNPPSTNSQWEVLERGFHEIYTLNSSSNLSFEELYRNGYKMVVAKDGEKLYKNTRFLIQTHLEAIVSQKIAPSFPQFILYSNHQHSSTPSSSHLANNTGKYLASNDELEAFLHTFNRVWLDHLIVTNMIKDVLMYLDRTFLPPRNLPCMFDTSIDTFRETVIACKSHPVKTNLVSALIGVLNNARDGALINKSLVADIFRILSSIPASSVHAKSNNMLDSIFEGEFLDASRLYYESESRVLIDPLSTKEYLEQAKRRLDQESQMMLDLGITKTWKKLKLIIETEMVAKYVGTIIKNASGLVDMIEEERYFDLSLLYEMLALVPTGHPELKMAVSEYVKVLGRDVDGVEAAGSTQPSGDAVEAAVKASPFTVWVDKILALKSKFDLVLEKSFQKDIAFEADINLSLQSIVALNPKNAEFISLYLDHHLRQVSKGKLGISEFEGLGNQAISTFRYLGEKDVFERYYKQHLAKRLLYVKSISEDAEKSILGKLKVECGYQFTSKLEGMFTDSRISLELSSEFKEKNCSGGGETKKLPEISLNILTSTYWPFTPSADTTCILPPELSSLLSQFEAFYMSRHSGRRLTWLKNMGTADVYSIPTPQSKRKELSMSTYCMVILISCFNEPSNPGVSFEKVKEITGIPSEEAKRALQSLSMGKYRILTKLSKGKEVGEVDEFKVNLEFSHPLSKIKILTISSGSGGGVAPEDAKERLATLEKIATDRRYQIEASIVRIMKSRKALQHNLLVAQVVEQLSMRFKPDILMVKKRIEELIERDYLERDQNDRNLYHYVA